MLLSRDLAHAASPVPVSPSHIDHMSRHRTMDPAQIKRQIAQGEPIVIHEGYALNLAEWIDRHPGGRLAILHMVGRDATDEINMYAARGTSI